MASDILIGQQQQQQQQQRQANQRGANQSAIMLSQRRFSRSPGQPTRGPYQAGLETAVQPGWPGEQAAADGGPATGARPEASRAGDEAATKAGPVMGIFFKVWSLVKVTKARHNSKLAIRRQASDDAGHFRYLSADQMLAGQGAGRCLAPGNQRDRFRRAGSQPATVSASVPAQASAEPPAGHHQRLLQVSPPVQLAASCATSASSSSGVSSASGAASLAVQPAAGRRAQSDSEQAPSRARLQRRAASQDEPASSPSGDPAPSAASSEQVSRLAGGPAGGGAFDGLGSRLAPANSEPTDDSDANEIYSTPNDSVQSVQAGLAEPGRSLVKSLSTNNFAQLARAKLASCGDGARLANETLLVAAGDARVNELAGAQSDGFQLKPLANAKSNRLASTTSRQFFISSSSSEDSSQNHNQPPRGPLDKSSASVALQLGHHQHPFLMNPSSSGSGQPSARLAGKLSPHWQPATDLYPMVQQQQQQQPIDRAPSTKRQFTRPTLDSFQPAKTSTNKRQITNSVSLHDCKLNYLGNAMVTNQTPLHSAPIELDLIEQFVMEQPYSQLYFNNDPLLHPEAGQAHLMANDQASNECSEYKLTQMLLKFGSDPSAKDKEGNTAMMHSIISDNLPALRCLLEQLTADNKKDQQQILDQLNESEQSAMDLVCSKRPNELRLEMLKLLIEANADLNQTKPSDGSRLLDRLIRQHRPPHGDKIPYIDCLLHYGAKLGSSTWLAAQGKFEIQLRLLRKLCHDGYFLYRMSSLDEAVYRFEYALKRLSEFEQQIEAVRLRLKQTRPKTRGDNKSIDLIQGQIASWTKAGQQVKYQTYLGLSRCELVLCL